MKKVILLIACVFLLTSAAYAGDVYYFSNDSSGIVTQKLAMDFGEGGISVASLEKMGYAVAIYDIDKDSPIGNHKADTPWVGYIIKGSVTSNLYDKEGDTTIKETNELKAGDLMFWEPGTFHGWDPGPKGWLSIWVRKM
jgi:quercetin dioxygenase-like cupin family protein